jgi:hypothetical protein
LKIKDQENAAKTIRKGFHDEISISGGEPRHQLAFAFHRLLCTPADEKDAGRWAKFNEDLTNQKGSLGRNPVIGDRLVTEDLAPLQRAGFERLAQSYNDEIGISRAPVLPISTTQRRRGNASKGARALLR